MEEITRGIGKGLNPILECRDKVAGTTGTETGIDGLMRNRGNNQMTLLFLNRLNLTDSFLEVAAYILFLKDGLLWALCRFCFKMCNKIPA